MGKLADTIWKDRRVAVTLHVLRVSSSSLRVAAASKRLSWYPIGGLLLGAAGARGLLTSGGWLRLFHEREDQVKMSALLLSLGGFLGLWCSRRPVLHVGLDAGTVHAGSLGLWEVDKPASGLRVVAATKQGGELPLPRGLLVLLNWMDWVNAEEQWTQAMAALACATVALFPAMEHGDRWLTRRLGNSWAQVAQSAAVLAAAAAVRTCEPFREAVQAWQTKLLHLLVGDDVPYPPWADPTRAAKFAPSLPRQCRPLDFEAFAKAARDS